MAKWPKAWASFSHGSADPGGFIRLEAKGTRRDVASSGAGQWVTSKLFLNHSMSYMWPHPFTRIGWIRIRWFLHEAPITLDLWVQGLSVSQGKEEMDVHGSGYVSEMGWQDQGEAVQIRTCSSWFKVLASRMGSRLEQRSGSSPCTPADWSL